MSVDETGQVTEALNCPGQENEVSLADEILHFPPHTPSAIRSSLLFNLWLTMIYEYRTVLRATRCSIPRSVIMAVSDLDILNSGRVLTFTFACAGPYFNNIEFGSSACPL